MSRPGGPAGVGLVAGGQRQGMAVARAAAEGCAAHVIGEYEFVELPGVSHWVPEQEPETVARHALARIAGQRAVPGEATGE